MDFNCIINKILPEVANGSNEPFIIYCGRNGGWECSYSQNQYSETYDWVEDVYNSDPLARIFKGSEFSQHSFAYVCGKVLAGRMSDEHHDTRYPDETYSKRACAILFCFEENISKFSPEVVEYLTTLDKPLAALYHMTALTIDLRSNDPTTAYYENKSRQFIGRVEQQVNKVIGRSFNNSEVYKEYVESAKMELDGYIEIIKTSINNRLILIAENPKAEHRYMVGEYRLNSPLAKIDNEFSGITNDYLEAMEEFTKRVHSNIRCVASIRENHKVMHGIEPVTLTAADCLADGLNENLRDRLIIIKADSLSPEFSSVEHQLKICTGGFGADPNSNGTTVFCKDLFSGEKSRFGRADVLGVADLEKLPEWAKKKMA